MPARFLADGAAGMKNTRALGRRQARYFEFFKSRRRNGRDVAPFFDYAGQNVLRLAQAVKRRNVLELQRKKIEGKLLKLQIGIGVRIRGGRDKTGHSLFDLGE